MNIWCVAAYVALRWTLLKSTLHFGPPNIKYPRSDAFPSDIMILTYLLTYLPASSWIIVRIDWLSG